MARSMDAWREQPKIFRDPDQPYDLSVCVCVFVLGVVVHRLANNVNWKD